MSSFEVVNDGDFEKVFKFPEEYKYFTSAEHIKGDFNDAKKILRQFKDGKFFVTNNLYEWFIFEIPNKVKILFYPHKVKSTSNVSTRARNQSSKDKDLFEEIKSLLTGNEIHNFWFKQSQIGFVQKRDNKKELAERLNEQWSENQETMGEMAAYNVACEMLDIDPDKGHDLLAKYCSVNNEEERNDKKI